MKKQLASGQLWAGVHNNHHLVLMISTCVGEISFLYSRGCGGIAEFYCSSLAKEHSDSIQRNYDLISRAEDGDERILSAKRSSTQDDS